MKAFLFDVDGTLLDSERIYMRGWQAAAAQLGFCLPDALMRRTRAIDPKIAARMMEAELGEGFSYEETRRLRLEIGEKMFEADGRLLKPGAKALLETLRGMGVPAAAVTSTDAAHTARHLELAGIAHLLPVRVTADMVSRGKPYPDMYLMAARLLGVDPAECCGVEDSDAGLRAVHAAGARPILVPDLALVENTTRALAWRIVDSLEDILRDLPALLAAPPLPPCPGPAMPQ